MNDPYSIRSMNTSDIPKFADIRPGFTSKTTLRVEKSGAGYRVGWNLVEVELKVPYSKGRLYDFDAEERRNIANRLAQSNTFMEVAIENATGRIVGVSDVEIHEWHSAAWIWNVMLDTDARGQGIGRRFVQHTIQWARQQGMRAVMLETQTNNVPACKFYAALGFQLVGINEVFYSNKDIENDEVALFWSYPIA